MDLKTAQLNQALAKGIGAVRVADQGVAFRIQYVGSPESSQDYADAVVVSATSIVLSVNGVADTSFAGASGTLLFATYTTLGLLVDQINTSSNWKAEIVAGLRSDTINGSELIARSTSTFRPFLTVEFTWDSSDNGVLGLDVLLEPGLPFEKELLSSAKLHRVGFQRAIGLVNSNAGEEITISVYELKPDKATTYKTLASFIATDNAEKDSGLNAPVLHADYGNSILVRFRGTGWIDTSAYLKVFGVRE